MTGTGYMEMPYSSSIRFDAIGPAYGPNRLTPEFLTRFTPLASRTSGSTWI